MRNSQLALSVRASKAVIAASLIATFVQWTGLRASEPAPSWSAEDVELFENRVRPVLAGKCQECHGAGKQEAGLRLDSREAILRGADSGPIAETGNPSESPLVAVIRYDGDVQMPPDGPLEAAEVEALVEWVRRGLPWPPSDGSEARTLTPVERMDEVRRTHWALQPIAPPEFRAITEGCSGAIDALILERLNEAGIEPSPVADRRTLIRRATFDLTGLPPTAAEVHAFEADESPDAYERLIDRLLDSPRYGERWGRHWLDVARYADTKGYAFGKERLFPYAYTYRDYVIRAFNEDLPFDQFVVEQLAADLLPSRAGNEHLAALGFLTVGRKYIRKEDTLDDQVDVVTRGLLGLTVSCARCHDHKYDPIPTADYYSLYGVFASCTEPDDLPYLGKPDESEAYHRFQEELGKRRRELDVFYDEKYREFLAELRWKGGEYLVAAASKLDQNESDGASDSGGSFSKDELRPNILRRWQRFLKNRLKADDPVFGPWAKWRSQQGLSENSGDVTTTESESVEYNALVLKAIDSCPPRSNDEMAKLYAGLLTQAYERGQLLRTTDSLLNKSAGALTRLFGKPESPQAESKPLLLAGLSQDERQLDDILFGEDSPPSLNQEQARRQLDRAARNKIGELKKHVDEFEARSPDAPPRAMALADAPEPVNQHIFIRGNSGRPGDEVPRQFLAVLSGGEGRQPFQNGSGRLELARAIVDPENPLTARVIANRLWQHHIGQPLVLSTSDFGARSDTPSHPELLDYLAWSLLDSGWSLKTLHREIMLSRTYQQSSLKRDDARRIDPENRLVWRMNRRRLEFESLRDTLLAVSGNLSDRMGGKSVDLMEDPPPPRRTVYGLIDRQDLPQLFRVFDMASPDSSSPGRPETTVPQQALFLMNAPFIQTQAIELAALDEMTALPTWPERVSALYDRLFARQPGAEELASALAYLGDLEPSSGHDADGHMNRWEQFVQVLLMTNEMLYVD